MKLQSYFRQVGRHLRMPKPDRIQVLSDFQKEAADSLGAEPEFGLLREQFGSPRAAAARLRQAHPDRLYRRSPWRYAFLILGILGLGGLAYDWILQLAAGLTLSFGEASSVAIIGGADGPTAIFVTSASGLHRFLNWFPFLLCALMGFPGFFCLGHLKPKA